MDVAIAAAAALAATGFTAELVRSHLHRARPHVAIWSAAMAMYAIATWSLVAGLAGGWTDLNFRAFYLFGAVTNVPFLALGAAYLVLGRRVGAGLLVVFSAFGAAAAAVTLGAGFVAALPESGVPAGSEVFASFVAPAGVEYTFGDVIGSPRLWAVVGNTIGSLLLVVLALTTIVRFRRINRNVACGNGLIIAGTIAPAFGGTLTGLGEGGGLALSLLAGALLLWAGYRVAGRARASDRVPAGGSRRDR